MGILDGSELLADYSTGYVIVSKSSREEVKIRRFVSGRTGRTILGPLYFESKEKDLEISAYCWELLYKRFPRIEENINKGLSIISLTHS